MQLNHAGHPFKYVLDVSPLGMMYGSAGAFLSPENLVGRSGAKFPPDAATIAGLIASQIPQQHRDSVVKQLQVAGPFIALSYGVQQQIYVPIPWTYSISDDRNNPGKRKVAQWSLTASQELEQAQSWHCDTEDAKADYTWQMIIKWEDSADEIASEAKQSSEFWQYNPILHPSLKMSQRCVEGEDGLFLENSVQMADNVSLIYLSSHSLGANVDWYRFGGEGHLAEIRCDQLAIQFPEFDNLLNQPIQRAFALITPAVWGSNRLSERYPTNWDFKVEALLTDKPVPFRHRLGGQLRRGRYAVPAGSVYVLDRPIDKPWYQWDEDWFPREGLSLKRFGTGLCLPIQIPGLDDN
jgi:CRISPR-associated protein Cmr3